MNNRALQSISHDPKINSAYTLHVNYIIITIVIIYLARQIEDIFSRRRRKQTVIKEREIYFDKLIKESNKMNTELMKQIEKLEQKGEELKSQLGDEDYWTDDDSVASSSTGFDDQIERLTNELDNLKIKKSELQSVEKKLRKVSELLEEKDIDVDRSELEAENKQLKQMLDNVRPEIKIFRKSSEVDLKIVQFLEKNEELTCDALGEIYTNIVEAKASGISFEDNFKDRRPNLEKEIAELTVENKKQQIKLESMKDRCKQEFMSLLEAEAKHSLANSVAEKELKFLNDLNDIDEIEVGRIKAEIEAKEGQLEIERKIFAEADEQHSRIHEEWSRMKEMRAESEAEANRRFLFSF